MNNMLLLVGLGSVGVILACVIFALLVTPDDE